MKAKAGCHVFISLLSYSHLGSHMDDFGRASVYLIVLPALKRIVATCYLV